MDEYENDIKELVQGPILEALAKLPEGELREEFAGLFKQILQATIAERERTLVFKNLCEANPQLIWTADVAGNHDYYNSQWLKYTGTTLEDNLNSGWLKVIHPEDRALCNEVWAMRVADGGNYEVELRLRRADGEWRWHLARCIAIRNENGVIEHWYGSYTEIEVQRRLMSELINARDQAQGASRLKSEFVANMSHELRTPMNGVLGMVEVLLRSDLNQKAREYTLMIREAGRSLLAVINDILDFSKIEAGKLELSICDFDLVSVVEGASEILAPQAESKDLELVTYIDPAIPEKLIGDPLRLRQVILNLGGNAVKFTETGSIVFKAEKMACEANCVRVKFSIEDSGIGIPDEQRLTLFEPFTQADGSISRKYGGTGLGLSISKQLVDLMGGSLVVESRERVGSTFSFNVLFPFESQATQPVDVAPGSTVLLVGLMTKTATCIRDYAKSCGLIVTAVDSFAAALTTLQSMPAPICVIVEAQASRDVCLQFGRKIRSIETLSAVRIVYITKLQRLAEFEQVINKSTETCLVRPIKRQELLNSLTKQGDLSLNYVHTQEVDSLKMHLMQPVSTSSRLTRVLVADDNKMNQHVARLLLTDMGLVVHVVDNGIEAVSSFKTNRYDIVFLDCQMPDIDGYEACRIIKQIQQRKNIKIPIIAMTANAMAGSREQCLASGMDDYISKPIDPSELEKLVRHWLDIKEKGHTGTALSLLSNVQEEEPKADFKALDIDLLRSRFNGKIVKQLLTMFIESAPDEVSRLEQSLVSQQFRELREQAHAFKGACGTICATELLQKCKEIELAASTADSKQCDAVFASLKSTLRFTLSEIDEKLCEN